MKDEREHEVYTKQAVGLIGQPSVNIDDMGIDELRAQLRSARAEISAIKSNIYRQAHWWGGCFRYE